MPEADRQGLRGEVFNRSVTALHTPTSEHVTGGIIFPGKYKSFIVNIRPQKWRETFWIGQIDNYTKAQFIADAVYYYIGQSSFHLENALENANFKFPPLQCSGISTPLTDREMCLKYASFIAKGKKFKDQRANLKSSVQKLVLELVKSVEVQRLLLQFRGESGSAAVPLEGVVWNDGDDGAQGGHPTPMEVDDHSEQAPQLSPLVSSSYDGLEVVNWNVEGKNAHVPSFNINSPDFTLQSDLTPVECSWVDTYLRSLENTDLEDHDESFNDDKEEFCSARRPAEENSFNPPQSSSVYDENFRVNFFAAMEDFGINSNW